MTREDLPAHLAARTRPLTRHDPNGSFVLYWMRTAVRARENPALDVALTMARALGVPVHVYHAVSERYPYASDRHHTFILEGARDVAAGLAARGIGTAFHCERPGQRGPHLRTLADQASLVVTEEMPVAPLRQWARSLADRTSTPVWAVDTACVVPMRLVGRGVTRAYAYRQRIAPLLDRFLAPWTDTEPACPPFVPDLPFTPVDWASDRICDLVAACAIDHTVGPVPHTRGGTKAALARWAAFREGPLRQYARRRNDPLVEGTSRLSPYLHYGMIAPTQVAREAQEAGAKKFVDELVVWRELAYTWCLYAREHETLEALPDWARQTLLAHVGDPRAQIYDLEALGRGRTGEPLWDAAQQSLLRHGELHNNVRMTWGKAMIGWTRGPQEALDALVDLNHRYALDGRDPASYGGLLWCLGQFDRPFPEAPIRGRVRGRSPSMHSSRLDVSAYRARVGRALVERPPSVAVVGGGPAGALCARTLADHGVPVTVFDKARGAGGRTSTRRDGEGRADHGAQYFTARERVLARYVRAWAEAGVIARWEGAFGTVGDDGWTPFDGDARWVGSPCMNQLVRHLLGDVTVRFGARVTGLTPAGSRWMVQGDDGLLGTFDQVLVAVPAPQAATLLAGRPFATELARVRFAPCWAALVAAPDVDPGWVGARVTGSALGWVARNGTKPGRTGPPRWVLHATPEWSRTHQEATRDAAGEALAGALCELPGLSGLRIEAVTAHHWRYALVENALGRPCLYDADAGLGVAGDGLVGSRLEAALLSGAALAGRVLGALDP